MSSVGTPRSPHGCTSRPSPVPTFELRSAHVKGAALAIAQDLLLLAVSHQRERLGFLFQLRVDQQQIAGSGITLHLKSHPVGGYIRLTSG